MPLKDFDAAIETVGDIKPDTSLLNPKLLSALLQYEKDTQDKMFALKIPDSIQSRKEFFCCKKNLQVYREYLYLYHGILITKSIDLLRSLFALHIFKIDQSDLKKREDTNYNHSTQVNKQLLFNTIYNTTKPFLVTSLI